ncbi:MULTISPECIES: DUF6572 domain-containing protein [Cupriavidus]|uniref:DUF6572 domain-containing protein n=1 Tax=Cupriavidus TaxID=106589 RepID=UPI000AF4491D|nr:MULTISPECIES: DUF6572 domain-containing protein [Cupriavidus]
MTVERSEIIDAIGIDAVTGAVHLSIIDPLPWDLKHLQLLQEKINTYLGFIESGEIYASYPEAKRRQLIVDVISRFRPDESAMQFLVRANEIVETYGASLLLRHSGKGYDGDMS